MEGKIETYQDSKHRWRWRFRCRQNDNEKWNIKAVSTDSHETEQEAYQEAWKIVIGSWVIE